MTKDILHLWREIRYVPNDHEGNLKRGFMEGRDDHGRKEQLCLVGFEQAVNVISNLAADPVRCSLIAYDEINCCFPLRVCSLNMNHSARRFDKNS